MDKCLMLAVAGSGKTTFLINLLNTENRFLLVTYTRNNHEHLRRSIIKKFGYIPEKIKVLTFFQFLYSFCFRPFCGFKMKTRGICFDYPQDWTRYHPGEEVFYKTKSGRMFSNRIAHFCKEHCVDNIKDRIDKYYDYFLIDEVQDIAGHDFNLLLSIIPRTCNTIFVGDYFQHTFDTSNDGNVNSSLYKNYRKYLKRWKDEGVTIDLNTLSKTHRCSNEICNFVRNMGIEIESTGESQGNVVVLDNAQDVDAIVNDDSIPKLFLSESSNYRCISMNWGASKGIDSFMDVCVVLNKNTLSLFLRGELTNLKSVSKNKLYVACTRAHRHLYITDYRFLEKYKKESRLQ